MTGPLRTGAYSCVFNSSIKIVLRRIVLCPNLDKSGRGLLRTCLQQQHQQHHQQQHRSTTSTTTTTNTSSTIGGRGPPTGNTSAAKVGKNGQDYGSVQTVKSTKKSNGKKATWKQNNVLHKNKNLSIPSPGAISQINTGTKSGVGTKACKPWNVTKSSPSADGAKASFLSSLGHKSSLAAVNTKSPSLSAMEQRERGIDVASSHMSANDYRHLLPEMSTCGSDFHKTCFDTLDRDVVGNNSSQSLTKGVSPAMQSPDLRKMLGKKAYLQKKTLAKEDKEASSILPSKKSPPQNQEQEWCDEEDYFSSYDHLLYNEKKYNKEGIVQSKNRRDFGELSSVESQPVSTFFDSKFKTINGTEKKRGDKTNSVAPNGFILVDEYSEKGMQPQKQAFPNYIAGSCIGKDNGIDKLIETLQIDRWENLVQKELEKSNKNTSENPSPFKKPDITKKGLAEDLVFLTPRDKMENYIFGGKLGKEKKVSPLKSPRNPTGLPNHLCVSELKPDPVKAKKSSRDTTFPMKHQAKGRRSMSEPLLVIQPNEVINRKNKEGKSSKHSSPNTKQRNRSSTDIEQRAESSPLCSEFMGKRGGRKDIWVDNEALTKYDERENLSDRLLATFPEKENETPSLAEIWSSSEKKSSMKQEKQEKEIKSKKTGQGNVIIDEDADQSKNKAYFQKVNDLVSVCSKSGQNSNNIINKATTLNDPGKMVDKVLKKGVADSELKQAPKEQWKDQFKESFVKMQKKNRQLSEQAKAQSVLAKQLATQGGYAKWYTDATKNLANKTRETSPTVNQIKVDCEVSATKSQGNQKETPQNTWQDFFGEGSKSNPKNKLENDAVYNTNTPEKGIRSNGKSSPAKKEGGMEIPAQDPLDDWVRFQEQMLHRDRLLRDAAAREAKIDPQTAGERQISRKPSSSPVTSKKHHAEGSESAQLQESSKIPEKSDKASSNDKLSPDVEEAVKRVFGDDQQLGSGNPARSLFQKAMVGSDLPSKSKLLPFLNKLDGLVAMSARLVEDSGSKTGDKPLRQSRSAETVPLEQKKQTNNELIQDRAAAPVDMASLNSSSSSISSNRKAFEKIIMDRYMSALRRHNDKLQKDKKENGSRKKSKKNSKKQTERKSNGMRSKSNSRSVYKEI